MGFPSARLSIVAFTALVTHHAAVVDSLNSGGVSWCITACHGRFSAISRRRHAQRGAVDMFFGSSSGSLPKLYDGWFKKTGQIQKDIVAGAKSALSTGKPVEVCFFPVPNIEEVSFGTSLNKAFGIEVAKDLGMDEYKPGSTIKTYLVQYSNAY